MKTASGAASCDYPGISWGLHLPGDQWNDRFASGVTICGLHGRSETN